MIKRKLLFFLTTMLAANVVCAQQMPMAYPINSPTGNEVNPCVSANGRTLIFENESLNDKQVMAVISYQKSGTWSRPEDLPYANTKIETIFNGNYFISANGNTLLFSSARYPGVGGNDIWMMQKNNTGIWGQATNLLKPISTAAHENDPAMSADGRFLYFTRLTGTSNPLKTPCGKIYVSERANKDTWKEAVELPAPINQGCECAPRLLADGKTLVFASTRAGGKGGYDLYESRLGDDGKWTNPVPLTFLNTDKDDRYISIPAGGGLVYHSVMTKTGYDLVRTPVPAELQPGKVLLYQGTIKDQTTGATIPGKVVVTSMRTKKTYIVYGANDGTFTVPFNVGEAFDVYISANDLSYSYQSMYIDLKDKTTFEEKIEEIKLIKSTPGAAFVLNNLQFENNTDKYTSIGDGEIGRVVNFMKFNPTLKAEILVYCDPLQRDTIQRPGLNMIDVDTISSVTDSLGVTTYTTKTWYHNDNTPAQAKKISNDLVLKGIPADRIKVIAMSDKREPIQGIPAEKSTGKIAIIRIK